MSEESTMTLAATRPSGTSSGDSSFSNLSPDIQRQLYGRLGGAALVYSGAWLVNYVYFQIRRHGEENGLAFWHVMTAICVAAGLLVFVLCRTKRIPPAVFANFASGFEILGAWGIMAGFYGWEGFFNQFATTVASALHLPDGNLAQTLVAPLEQHHVRIAYHDGVSWVSVWLLVFPLVVPAPTRRTAVATLLTAATVPAMLLLSVAIHGVPEGIRGWIAPYVIDLTIPTFICAGMAIGGSRVVYGLTRELSKVRQMGSYQLVDRIGAGGMGEVWRARHRMLARPAAIKLIRGDSLGGSASSARMALKRFEREAQATSALTSPHSIELYDFGINDDGTFFYVMELLDGLDLRTLVERHGPLPAERTIHILRQVCHSLTDAHYNGIVHRDVKPGNVFVCRRGPEVDFVKVLDFGLVKHIGESGPQLTMEGVPSGTPAFMAPETTLDARSVDARADIYAVGCLAYWLLTGHLVFVGDSPMAILLQHVKDPPPPPSTRTELPIPPSLERLVLACLEKDVTQRPQSARDLAFELAETARTLPPWTEERAIHWWRTHLPHLVLAASNEPVTAAVVPAP